MALQLSRREVDDLKSSIDRAIYRIIGKSDSSLLSTVSSCLVNGYERRKFIDKISSHIESKKASKLADKVIALAEEFVANAKSSSYKRKHEDSGRDKDKERGSTEHKRSRSDKHDIKETKQDSRHESKQDAKRDLKPDKESETEKKIVKEKEPEPLPYLAKPEDMLEGLNGSAMELPLPPPILGEGETIGSKIAGLSADRIKLMMANAQKEISERKRALQTLTANANNNAAGGGATLVGAAAARANTVPAHVARASIAPPSLIKPQLFAKPEIPASVTAEELEKQRKIAELQARIQRKLAGGALKQTSTDGPAPLILDREGRTVDTSGRVTQLTQVAPTLKANIRAKRRTEFRAQLSAATASTATESLDSRFLDPRVGAKPPTRAARPLKFHEPGKFVQMADRLRMKAQLEKLQGEISQIARKTGISSATKLALLSAETAHDNNIPDIEWWDSVILMTPEEREARRQKIAKRAANVIDLTDDPTDDVSIDLVDDRSDEQRVDACNTGDDDILQNLNDEAITELVEHPQQLRPPTEPLKPPLMPVFLTPRERKKLRRQSRREAWKEEQEKVRLGLEAPPEPKLRISNLMRALGTEAVQDPTAIEAKVREQIAKRQKTHQDANQARALTKEQRKDKIDSKIREDTTMGVHVGVYRIRDLFECASAKFKVEKNAQQLHMTGCVLLHRGCCVVVVEGGPKQHSKYKRLMLQRIKWQEATVKDTEGQDVPNECRLVWEGVVKQRAFGDIKFKVSPTEKLAREHFQKYKVEHYWDLAYSAAVLGSAVEDP